MREVMVAQRYAAELLAAARLLLTPGPPPGARTALERLIVKIEKKARNRQPRGTLI